MTLTGQHATSWWAALPTGRVTRLTGATAEAIVDALDPLPDGAPAVVAYHPDGAGSAQEQVELVLAELDRAAVALFPHWLPGAESIAGPQGAGVAAVRALAGGLAARTHHFGPFLADVAERALRGGAPRRAEFAPVVRAAGLARIIAASYGRPQAAMLITVPGGLSSAQQRVLVHVAEWLAGPGGFGVWLAGAATEPDRIESSQVRLPGYVSADWIDAERRIDRPAIRYPALAGVPAPGSRAENALEAALARCPWASGRIWNSVYRAGPLSPGYRLDLWWKAERCVVEIDGPEHWRGPQYRSDRQRDNQLQLDGYAVLRFTNDQVFGDIQLVLAQLEKLLRSRKPDDVENQHHA